MKTISIAFFILSIIVGISTAAKMTPKGQMPEHTVLFVMSLMVGIIALIFWHKAVRQEAKELVTSDYKEENPMTNIDELFRQMTELKNSGLAQEGFCDHLDDLSEGPIFQFHENSDILKELLGQEKAAEIILALAQTERMINRAWSAFSDGYSEEAIKSYNLAYKNLESIVAS